MTSLQPIPLAKPETKKGIKPRRSQAFTSNKSDDVAWERLEKRLGSDGYPGQTMSDFTGNQDTKSIKGSFVCVVGGTVVVASHVSEPVFIAFEWHNTLQIPLPINNLFLECEVDGKKMDRALWPLQSGAEPPAKLQGPDFDVEVLPDSSLDSNERRIASLCFC